MVMTGMLLNGESSCFTRYSAKIRKNFRATLGASLAGALFRYELGRAPTRGAPTRGKNYFANFCINSSSARTPACGIALYKAARMPPNTR